MACIIYGLDTKNCNFGDFLVLQAIIRLASWQSCLIMAIFHPVLPRHYWRELAGVASHFAVAANKYSIYPEYALAWMPFSNHGERDRWAAAAQSTGVNIIDASPAIRAEKYDRQWLYNHMDAHWTCPAAFVGYSTILAALQNHGVPIEILPKDSVRFKVTTYPVSGGG
jgi:SGNH hydrolase-like domain, acetyltransferase AlgX